MRSPSIYCTNESSMGRDMSSLKLVKSSSTCCEGSDIRRGSETDSSGSGMDENNSSLLNTKEKDSGVDVENDLIVVDEELDEELVNKIVNQVESYFSDENLIKDEFLLKHIRRNKEGFISLKLVASLRKVKVLTKNWKVVAHSIKTSSNKLQINDLCNKIRRITPLPSVDGTKHSRTLIVYNFPNGSDSVEEIGKVFAKYGDISLIRILRPNPDVVIPSNLLSIIGDKFDLKKTTFATIEFNNKSDAEKALKNMEINKHNNWRNSLEVIPMKPSIVKPNNNTIKCSQKYSKKDQNSSESHENSSAETKRSSNIKKSFNKQVLNEISTHCESNKNSNKYQILRRQKSKSCSGDESIQFNRINNNLKQCSQPQRPVNRFINTNSTQARLPKNIIREPFGPIEGSKGFNTTRQSRSHSEP